MKRRSLLTLAAWSPLALFTSRHLRAKPTNPPSPAEQLQQAEQLNHLASTIETLPDARLFVDFLANLFAKETPSTWTSNSVRNQIAQAEFAAVTDRSKAIPESRLAETWNTFVDTLGAPQNQKVATPELHNLRDAFLTTARAGWKRGSRNFRLTPSIYATLPDGHLAPGCRAVESIRLLWDLFNHPDNIQAARERASKGILTSDLYAKPPQTPTQTTPRAWVSATARGPYPIELAQRTYIQRNGNRAFNRAVLAMLSTIFT